MTLCLHIWVQLRRSLTQSSRTWRFLCPSGSAPTVGGTWSWRRRGKEMGEKESKDQTVWSHKYTEHNIPPLSTNQLTFIFGLIFIWFVFSLFYRDLKFDNACCRQKFRIVHYQFILFFISCTLYNNYHCLLYPPLLSPMCPPSCSKYLSCVGYPSCKTAVWFPDMVLDVNRDDTICPTCQPSPVHM